MVESHWGVQLPDPIELMRAEGAFHSTSGVVRAGIPAGDLTGDGFEDVISEELTFPDFTFSYKMLRGTDGAELWSLEPTGNVWDTFPLLVGDLTGDGAEDVLVVSFVLDDDLVLGGCFIAGCALAIDASYRWTFDLRSGVDGSNVWTREYAGSLQEIIGAGGFLASAFAVAYQAENVSVLPLLSGDHDGDGVADLVFDAFDVTVVLGGAFAWGLVAFAYAFDYLYLVGTEAEVVSGADATSQLTRSQDEIPGGAWLLPAGDAVGDDVPDLMWQTYEDVQGPFGCAYVPFVLACADVYDSDLTVEMIDGSTFEQSWEVSREDPVVSLVYPAFEDLDGDGADDLLVIDVHWSPVCLFVLVTSACDSRWDQGVVAGADGETLWLRDDLWFPVVVGSVGGEPGADLIDVDFDYSYDFATDTYSVSASLERIEGANGSTLLTTEHTSTEASDTFVDLYLYLAGDMDADAVTDIGIERFTYTYGVGYTEGSLDVESGRTGDVAVSTSLTVDDNTFEFGLPAGDPDGDGLDDMYLARLDFAPTAIDVGIRLLATGTGSVAWSRTDSFTGNFERDDYIAFLLRPADDMNGTGTDDAVYSRLFVDGGPPDYVERLSSRVEAFEGADGTTFWGYGDSL